MLGGLVGGRRTALSNRLNSIVARRRIVASPEQARGTTGQQVRKKLPPISQFPFSTFSSRGRIRQMNFSTPKLILHLMRSSRLNPVLVIVPYPWLSSSMSLGRLSIRLSRQPARSV
ncbi:hypothetical protein ACMYSQ_004440 [Aspergillus niger]